MNICGYIWKVTKHSLAPSTEVMPPATYAHLVQRDCLLALGHVAAAVIHCRVEDDGVVVELKGIVVGDLSRGSSSGGGRMNGEWAMN